MASCGNVDVGVDNGGGAVVNGRGVVDVGDTFVAGRSVDVDNRCVGGDSLVMFRGGIKIIIKFLAGVIIRENPSAITFRRPGMCCIAKSYS